MNDHGHLGSPPPSPKRQRCWLNHGSSSPKTKDAEPNNSDSLPPPSNIWPTIYVTGSPEQTVRGIASELKETFETAFSMEAVELKPPITHGGRWGNSKDGEYHVPNMKQGTDGQNDTVVTVPFRLDPDATTPLYSMSSHNQLVRRIMNPETRKSCIIVYDTESLNKESTIENYLFHQEVATQRGSPFYPVSIKTEPNVQIIRGMVGAGIGVRGGLGKIVVRSSGVRRHSVENDEEYGSRKRAEYMLDTTWLTAKAAAESIVEHFQLEHVCKR